MLNFGYKTQLPSHHMFLDCEVTLELQEVSLIKDRQRHIIRGVGFLQAKNLINCKLRKMWRAQVTDTASRILCLLHLLEQVPLVLS